MKNALYVRVSTDDQALHGYSLDDQRQACRSHLLKMGLTNIEEYIDDGYSGEYLERPGLERLRTDLLAGNIQTVAIYDPDRLSRNLTNQLIIADEIEKSGAQVTFITGDYDASPEGRLFFNMKGAVSAYEKAKIRERTSRGRRAKAVKGKIVHNARPFGYGWDAIASMYIIDEKEAAIVRLIYRNCIDNGWGIRLITLELAHKGIIGRKDRPLSPATVGRILSKEMYCGSHHQFKQSARKTGQHSREIRNTPRENWLPVKIPAIVSRETWLLAQAQLQQNKHFAKRNTNHNYLLSRLLRCGLCGRSLTASARSVIQKSGIVRNYYYYTCISNASSSYVISNTRCNCHRIPADALDEAVWQTIVEIALKDNSIYEYLCATRTKNYSKEIETTKARQTSLQKKRSDLVRWYQQNMIDSNTVETELTVINKQLHAAFEKLADLELVEQKINQPALSPADFLNTKTFAEKREVLMHFPYQIQVFRLGKHFQFYFKE